VLGRGPVADDGDNEPSACRSVRPWRAAVSENHDDIRDWSSGLGDGDADAHVRAAAAHQADVGRAAHASNRSHCRVARQDHQPKRADARRPDHAVDLGESGVELRLTMLPDVSMTTATVTSGRRRAGVTMCGMRRLPGRRYV